MFLDQQTWILIRLNFNRLFLKAKTKWLVLLLFVLNVGLFAMYYAMRRPSSPMPEWTIPGPSPVRMLYFDDSAVPNSSIEAILTKEFNVTRIQKESHLESIRKSGLRKSPFFVEFLGEKEYSLHYVSGHNPDSIKSCLGETCSLLDMDGAAILMTRLNRVLTDSSEPPFRLQPKRNKKPGFIIDFYQDFLLIILAMMISDGLFEDKEKGIKFGLFMTGVKRSSYYIGFLSVPMTISLLYGLLNFVCQWLLLSKDMPGAIAVMGTFYVLTSLAAPAAFWFLAQICSSKKIAYVLSLLYFFMGVIVTLPEAQQFLLYQSPTWLTVITCVNPRVATIMFTLLSRITPSSVGFSSETIVESTLSINGYVFSSVGWTIVLILLACYFDWLEVSQDERKPFYYPITMLFSRPSPVFEKESYSKALLEDDKKDRKVVETVTIENLTKQYNGSSTRALSNVSFQFSKGEIFGLLGYNGAGKSTLINILCGVLSPTAGSITVFGIDASTNRFEIAKKTGICSQKDILFDSLTVEEHLFYFGLLRNVEKSAIKARMDYIVDGLQMEDMLKSVAGVLSGGQKRKLCVAIAFIHDPELVVLDEMSSGVDPENRRVIWDFLFKNKENRAILLCTHFMDEADIVTERKAMLTLGKLVCLGSSRFLKHTYDTGYTLSIEKSSSYEQNEFGSMLEGHGIQAKVVKSNTQVVEYRLRNNDVDYSIRENGLEEIFSDNRIVEEGELNISKEDRDEIISIMKQFVEPSFISKLKCYGIFELKRSLSGLLLNLARLFLPIGLLVAIIVYFLTNSKNGYSITPSLRLTLDDIIGKLFLKSMVIETNVGSLISRFQEKYVPIGQTPGGQILAGTFTQNSTVNLYTGDWNFLGPLFFTIKEVFGSGVKSFIEFDKITYTRMDSTSIPVCILLNFMMFELNYWMTEEIADSRKKIKFLLLSSGVPLLAYWIITILRLLVFVVPFVILSVVFMPTEFLLSVGFVVLYALQFVFLGSLLGSYFSKAVAKGINQLLGFGYLMIFVLLLILQNLMGWKPGQWTIFIDIFNYSGTGIPIGQAYALIRGEKPFANSTVILIAAGHCVLYLSLLIAVELSHVFVKSQTTASNAFISFKDVTKSFSTFQKLRIKKKVAVDDLSLEINQSEMFALLGPNGCGKTTTLSMLTAQQRPTSGSIHVDSVHVASKRLEIIKALGYCPQFDDLLIERMSVFSHLQLFCFMNGMGSEATEKYIGLLLKAFGIERFRDYNCGSLSGGTKRKVSAAIAIMLPRSLVVLDEASTGLDPLARQKLWNTVRLLSTGKTTIITTHYVNETSVCDRIAIMNEGKLKCCDTEHELTKLTNGYNFTLYFNGPVFAQEWLNKTVLFDDPNPIVKVEQVSDFAIVQLDSFTIPLFTILGRLQACKSEGILVDFSVARKSLENIFLEMVRKKEEEKSSA